LAPDQAAVERVYRTLLERWNARDAGGFARLFEDDGHSVGFDGSEMHGPVEIESALAAIFADHETASYVAKIRDVRFIDDAVAVLSAVVGMVPPGRSELNPDVNAVQTLVAKRSDDGWRIALLQSTPAQYHGRPEAAAALTAELRTLLKN
jgi:uncharacterized protein (TIGR02246 family)